MNNKITFPELVELVAKRANTSKRVSELFLKELFATISQSLTEGDSVKVKGLGVFKLTTVSARKSVNVNTGEEINIPGHNKLTFVPDKALADAVNQPFAQFETEILSDDVTDEQLAAIDANEPEVAPSEEETPPPLTPFASVPEIPADEPGTPAETPETGTPPMELPPVFAPKEDLAKEQIPLDEPEFTDAPVHEENPASVEEEKTDFNETTVPLVAAIPVVENTAENTEGKAVDKEQETGNEPEVIENPVQEDEVPEGTFLSDKEKRKITHRAWLEGFVIGVVAAAIIALVCFRLFFSNSDNKDNTQKAQPIKAEQQPEKDTAVTITEPAAAPADTTASMPATPEPAKEETKPAEEPQPEQEAKPVTETVVRSTTLSKLAIKHYGNPHFWVYIYEENMSKYSNPDNIPLGSVLVIPPASKYGIDAHNKKSVAKAKKEMAVIKSGKATAAPVQ